MEKSIPLSVSLVKMSCDECGDGEMLPSEVAAPEGNPGILHVCNKCEHQEPYGFKYPTLRYNMEATAGNLSTEKADEGSA